MTKVNIFCNTEDRPGWMPVLHMIRLGRALLGAQVTDVRNLKAPLGRKFRLQMRKAPTDGQDIALCIARTPREIDWILAAPDFLVPHRCRVLWIIDSFRTQHLPPAKRMTHFDVIAYTQGYDGDHYRQLYGDRALHLGWGSDVLDLGGFNADRPFDVLRCGREPTAWDDDTATAQACAARSLRFHGRPPNAEDLTQQQPMLLRDYYGQTKFLVAHSNLAAPDTYTHKSKEYITARWTDAIAAGAVVAGVQPHSDLALLDWPEAVLDFDRIDLFENLDQLALACARWTPDIARSNHIGALKNLDWRWRFKTLAERIDLSSQDLDAEINRLRARISDLDAQTQNRAV